MDAILEPCYQWKLFTVGHSMVFATEISGFGNIFRRTNKNFH